MSSSSSMSLSSFSLSSFSSDNDSGKSPPFFSLPAKCEPPGTESPPLETAASVPFSWEEAPGRPKHDQNEKSDKKCLELPPRLSANRRHHGRITNMPSPTTVLDEPDIGRSLTYGVSFRSFRNPESFVRRGRAGYFGSSRWGGSFDKNNVVGNDGDFFEVEGITDFSSSVFDGSATDAGDPPAKMGKNKKSFKSYVLGSIYGGLKQIVHWKRRERARK